MSNLLLPEEFIHSSGTIFDVRSPGEFNNGHIPGAINLPLFSNDERAIIGTLYKQQGQKAAISLGLQIAGPKLSDFVSQAQSHLSEKTLAKIHCWRGGMRSGAMSWLLSFAGFPTATLRGGYKSFRNWALSSFKIPYQFFILGGMTGSGKTAILRALKSIGEQTLDLEAIANHSGSSFGVIGKCGFQPTQEQFENEIAGQLSKMHVSRPIWIEDESRLIGCCSIPPALFDQMRNAPLFIIDVPMQERVERLLNEYGNADPKLLIEATSRLSKRLGGLRTKEIIEAIQRGYLQEAMEIILQYYDSAYSHTLTRRPPLFAKLEGNHISAEEWAERIRQMITPH